MLKFKLIDIFFAGILFYIIKFAHSSCPNHCNSHGSCDVFARCTCAAGYKGADCSLRICPFDIAWQDFATATDTAHALAECSNRGICNRGDGVCSCMDGFSGHACERLVCPSNCFSNGRCMSMQDRASRTRNLNSQSYLYNAVWDAKKVWGCTCDIGYGGYDCASRSCPVGDDPLTTGQVNEIQLLKCVAISGSFVLYYKGTPSISIPYYASAATVKAALLTIPTLRGASITFSITTGQVCQTIVNVVSIEFTHEFGPQPPLVAVIDTVMSTKGGSVSIAGDGTTSVMDGNGITYYSVKGTKETSACAGRGLCTTTDGTCTCYSTNGDTYASSNGYGLAGSRGDCGFIYSGTTVASCPGEVQCSGHGVCQSTHTCNCAVGWTGGDCSQRTCPTGLSWYDYPTSDNVAHATYTTCSDMGECDLATGVCTCNSGFFGQACDKMVCGGGLSNPCTGHGRCMTVYEMSLWAQTNGDAMAITYGRDPNNALTWDGKRIHGCMCDPGYTGYDCSLHVCPVGDDPGTFNDHNEVQLFKCVANQGWFTLKFRQFTTPPIGVNATLGMVRAALMSLPSLTDLDVFFSLDFMPSNTKLSYLQPPDRTLPQGAPNWGGFNSNDTFVPIPRIVPKVLMNTSVCSTDGSQIVIIYFATTPGNLPSLTAQVSALSIGGNPGSGSVTIYADGQSVTGKDNHAYATTFTSIPGTTEVATCNNRGICDQTTGLCRCFATWSSSDGRGNPGNLNDCAYRNDHLNSYDPMPH